VKLPFGKSTAACLDVASIEDCGLCRDALVHVFLCCCCSTPPAIRATWLWVYPFVTPLPLLWMCSLLSLLIYPRSVVVFVVFPVVVGFVVFSPLSRFGRRPCPCVRSISPCFTCKRSAHCLLVLRFFVFLLCLVWFPCARTRFGASHCGPGAFVPSSPSHFQQTPSYPPSMPFLSVRSDLVTHMALLCVVFAFVFVRACGGNKTQHDLLA
jgi:hypothetical protein